ncbi:hypothetical protein D3C80_1563410 [compost metagenome]
MAHLVAQHGCDLVFALDVLEHAQGHEDIAVRIGRRAERIAVDDTHLQRRCLPWPTFGKAGDDALQVGFQLRDPHQVLLTDLIGWQGSAIEAQAQLAGVLKVQPVVLAHLGVFDITAFQARLGGGAHQVHQRVVGPVQCLATTEQAECGNREGSEDALHSLHLAHPAP